MKTINVYNFNELSDSSKEVAIDNFRYKLVIDLDFFNDDCKEIANENGFIGDISLQYSLSYCQGDGLSFGCDYFDSQQLYKIFVEVLGTGKDKTIETIMNNSYFKLKSNNGHYCYASKSDLDYEFDGNIDAPNIEEVVGKVQIILRGKYLDLCKELEKNGYDEIKYQQSDEYISEFLEANEYEFSENGIWLRNY